MVLTRFLKRIRSNTLGATAVEYGLILSLVVIAMAGALQAVANQNTRQWSAVSDQAQRVMQNN